MSLQDIGAFISTIGFPVACCVFLLYSGRKDEERQREQQDELRKTIDNNTKSIDKLTALVKELATIIKGV